MHACELRDERLAPSVPPNGRLAERTRHSADSKAKRRPYRGRMSRNPQRRGAHGGNRGPRTQTASTIARGHRETLVFRGAAAAALVHALDDAFLNRQPGVPWDQHWLAALISVVIAAAAVVAYPSLRSGARVGLAA